MSRYRLVSPALFTFPLLVALAGCSGGDHHAAEQPTADAGSPDAAPPAPDSGTADGSLPDEIRTMEIPVGDFVFDARVAGPEDGELVLLLHGFPETGYEWRHALGAVARAGFRGVAPDQRGYSPRARPPAVSDYTVLSLAQDVVGMADALGAQRFHLVGHDWGAGVAWAVAVLAKDRVIDLTAVSVPHPDAFAAVLADHSSCQYAASSYFDFFTTPAATDFFVADDFAALRSTYAGVPAADVDEYVRTLGSREAIDAALNWYRANVANRQLNAPALGPVLVPTLFVWSDADTALCRDGADLTAQYVQAPYRFEVLSGVNHWVADNAPDQLDALLVEHVSTYSEK